VASGEEALGPSGIGVNERVSKIQTELRRGRKSATQRALRAEHRGHGADIPDAGVYPPPGFSEKRLQAVENKGRESEKESQEKTRGGKWLKG
jgi:hypothetical protein